ncbi:hypothetical protein RND81_08G172200 [Saponaria officinalis]|uniref:GIR1-like zinc ribbon domain-containing protein n=1 Tax=Saponaria officinalis TaxID=3572 RepID=A0AAW1J9N8_SAPOF
MGTEVSWLIKNDAKSGLITRDFLGGVDSQELDLDLHVPFGWEKHLDLKSGQVYIERCNNPTNKTSDHKTITFQISSKSLQNSSSSSSSSQLINPTLNLLKQPSLDLKLLSNPSHSTYTSVCTLDKVKSALDRAERSSPSSSSSSRKRWMASSTLGGSSSNSSSKETESEVEKRSSKCSDSSLDQCGLLVAAACPECFLYVLISENDPKCPNCNSVVQSPVMVTKKPKIDLNI